MLLYPSMFQVFNETVSEEQATSVVLPARGVSVMSSI